MVVAWTYAVAVNFVPSYKLTVDKVGESTVGLQNQNVKDEEAVVGTRGDTAEKDLGHADASLDKEGGPVHIER
jgi:FHS family L-fucose permease-like MFS transporter